MGCAHRNLRRAISDTEGAGARTVRANEVKASLEEPASLPIRRPSQKSEQLPSFNAYSVDGDVTGPLVYVNYGRRSDYQELEKRGISVKGAIVIARYGQSWRGIKPKVAASMAPWLSHLLGSQDDGYFVDGVFPDGPMRNRDGVQRGSVMDVPPTQAIH